MKNLRKNKKLMATLIAGILLMTAAIGIGTWAWYSGSSTAVIDTGLNTASIQVAADTSDVDGYWFPYNDQAAIVIQKKLASGVSADIADAFAAYNVAAFRANLIPNAYVKNTGIWSVEIGTVLEGSATYNVNSFSPTYIRFKVPAFSIALDTVQNVIVTLVDSDPADATAPPQPTLTFELADLKEDGGWYYCPYPSMYMFYREVSIVVQDYILPTAGNAGKQHQAFTYVNGGIEAEVIQAGNNAAWQIPGWDVAAVGDYFIDPHTIPAYCAIFNCH